MGGNGTAQFAYQSPDLVKVLNAARKGNFKVRIPAKNGAVPPEVAAGLNQVFAVNQRMAQELEELRRERKDLLRALEAFEEGDFAARAAEGPSGSPVKGAFLQMANTINTMVGQLKAFASEVTRVAREVGTDGKLGGQAQVKGVAGAWKGLTDNVNSMARNLTNQVRNIADVTTAVAKGDLSKKITVEAKGEIRQLKDTINTMVDQLNAFASEVARVAREVGTQGKLGGQAEVEGVAGAWKDLTDNVNSMASNLPDQAP